MKILAKIQGLKKWEDVLVGISKEEEVEKPMDVEEEVDDNGDDDDEDGGDDDGDSGGDEEGGDGDETGGDGRSGGYGDEVGGEGDTGEGEGDDGGDAGGDGGDGENFGDDDNGGKGSRGDNFNVEWTESDDDESVETNFSLDRSKWFKPLPSILDPIVQKPKKTDDISKIISWMYDSVKDLFVIKRKGGGIQYYIDVHALQSLPCWDIRTLSKLNIINPHNIGVANFAESFIVQ
ncbi:hypothetical protein L1987_48620 [Smallanthus sonchifolius]|uniref:Uncharacterized protein n=1 Tax=Smallanthus sonchifolius TaxID=185202 RepID=A0ACB9FSA1_9ASTR|nr:hypothetical protein L1987_48620 [Smallanthus sonchifolius]